MRRPLPARLSSLLESIPALPITEATPAIFGVSRKALLSAVAEALDLGLAMCQRTPTGPVLIEDDCPTSDYAPPSEAIHLCAKALGLHGEVL